MNLFGWQLKIGRQQALEDSQPSVAMPVKDDGAVLVEAAVGGAYGTYVDLDQQARTDSELITRYRNMSLAPEVDLALRAIKGEAVVHEESHEVVELNLDEVKDVPPALSDKLDQAFDRILDLLEFREKGHDVFMRWYIDGRLYYQALLDPQDPRSGLTSLRYLDPRKIRKVREVKRQRDPNTNAETVTVVREYYVYAEQGFDNRVQPGQPQSTSVRGVRIAKDAISYVPSGLLDETGKIVVSYLHKAIKNLNMLRAITDAMVISRLARAPERRIFYVDIGGLPRAKAEQHLRDQMARYKNRVVYDQETGMIRDDRKFTTMLEDIWMPRRDNNKTTEIDTLPGLQNDGIRDDVAYFAKALNRSLNVPIGRLEPENMVAGLTGRVGEVTREEVDFGKFIDELRVKFCTLFTDLLGKQAILTGIVTPDEWEQIKPKLRYRWARDNSFAEQKDLELLRSRLEVLGMIKPFVGMYYSNRWLRKYVLRQTDEDIRNLDREIQQEASNPQYMMVDPETGMLVPPPLAAGPPVPLGLDSGPAPVEAKSAPKPKPKMIGYDKGPDK
jgi:hypothetical protein